MADEKQDSTVKIIPYDPKAPKIFEDIKQFLCNIVPFHIEVEHIGSTAVPGLGGKGVIDTLIITKQEYMQKIVELLELKGYKFNPEIGFGTFPERFFISGPYRYKGKELHVHFHITFLGSNEHKDKLLFRDYLRKHPEEAETYFNLKKRWSVEVASEKLRFAELKTPYINEVLEKARKEVLRGKIE